MDKKNLNDLNIGDFFYIEKRKFKIVKSNECGDCCFKDKGCGILRIYDLRPDCDCFLRKDKTNIVFIEVENEGVE